MMYLIKDSKCQAGVVADAAAVVGVAPPCVAARRRSQNPSMRSSVLIRPPPLGDRAIGAKKWARPKSDIQDNSDRRKTPKNK